MIYILGFQNNLSKYVTIKVKNNKVTDLSSPYPFPETHTYNYYSIGEIKQDVFWNESEILFNVIIMLDSEYQQISRSVYSFSDLIGQVGGFSGLLIAFSSLFVSIFSQKIYTQSIMSNVYQVNQSNIQKRTKNNRVLHEEIKSKV